TAKGDFVGIFDAAFVPGSDFLHRTIHHFTNPKVGMVQARWEHLNRDYSFLTRTQAIFLDGHFILESFARFLSGRFFNFNGTAGILRRVTIEDASGWSHLTLTEDLYSPDPAHSESQNIPLLAGQPVSARLTR